VGSDSVGPNSGSSHRVEPLLLRLFTISLHLNAEMEMQRFYLVFKDLLLQASQIIGKDRLHLLTIEFKEIFIF
jgi:hypothetical protein